MGQEFEPCDWDLPNVRYTITCSIMAEFYKDGFALDYGFELIPQKRCPSCAADLLARVVPFLSFATVVDNPILDSEGKLQGSLSYEGMPYEYNYNSAISNVLSNTLEYTVTNPLVASGKTDVVVTLDDNKTCAIQCIMASRGGVSRNCQYHLVLLAFSTELFIMFPFFPGRSCGARGPLFQRQKSKLRQRSLQGVGDHRILTGIR